MKLPSLRTLFALAWIGTQGLLVVTAGERVNHAFGFRMFEEMSTVTLHLERESASGRAMVPRDWYARDRAGVTRRYRWDALVPRGPLLLGGPQLAPYGVDARVAQIRAAIAWVATHTPDDTETRAFVATLHPVKNGRALPPITFTVPR